MLLVSAQQQVFLVRTEAGVNITVKFGLLKQEDWKDV